MDRPRPISSGEAMRWNDDVERRRREYHEQRCAEDPIYRRAYSRQQEMMQRMQKMQGAALAQLANAICDREDTRCQQEPVYVLAPEQKPKTYEEMMHDFDLLGKMDSRFPTSVGMEDCPLAAGVLAMLFADPVAEQRLQELEEEKPYAEEIRRADAEFDKKIIRLSGFEW